MYVKKKGNMLVLVCIYHEKNSQREIFFLFFVQIDVNYAGSAHERERGKEKNGRKFWPIMIYIYINYNVTIRILRTFTHIHKHSYKRHTYTHFLQTTLWQ